MLCAWGMLLEHPTGYELALVRNARALEAADLLGDAYHAAGHAIAAVLRHIPFATVSLASGLDLTPALHVLTDPALTTATRRRRARRVIEVCLAGAEAERCLTRESTPHTCPSCVVDAGAWMLAGRPEPTAFCISRRSRMHRLMQRQTPRVHALAMWLLNAATLTADDVHAVVRRTHHAAT